MNENYYQELLDAEDKLYQAIEEAMGRLGKLEKLLEQNPQVKEKVSEGIEKLSTHLSDAMFTCIHEIKDKIFCCTT